MLSQKINPKASLVVLVPICDSRRPRPQLRLMCTQCSLTDVNDDSVSSVFREDMSERMAEWPNMSDKLLKDMSERMSDDTLERMSENMSERYVRSHVRKNVRRRRYVRRMSKICYVRKNVKRYVRKC